jgi:hypothetical protein
VIVCGSVEIKLVIFRRESWNKLFAEMSGGEEVKF